MQALAQLQDAITQNAAQFVDAHRMEAERAEAAALRQQQVFSLLLEFGNLKSVLCLQADAYQESLEADRQRQQQRDEEEKQEAVRQRQEQQELVCGIDLMIEDDLLGLIVQLIDNRSVATPCWRRSRRRAPTARRR